MINLRKILLSEIMGIFGYDVSAHHNIWLDLPDIKLCKRIAIEHEIALHEYDNDLVIAAYCSLCSALGAQYNVIRQHVTILPYHGNGEPYQGSNDFFKKFEKNKCIFYLKTANTHGHVSNNCMLWRTDCYDSENNRLCFNDVFRVVHDIVGHYIGQFSFSGRGEYNATLSHLSTLPKAAWPALLCETFCQTCVFEFGSHLWRDDGTIPQSGDIDFIPRSERPFAEQKNYIPRVAYNLLKNFR